MEKIIIIILIAIIGILIELLIDAKSLEKNAEQKAEKLYKLNLENIDKIFENRESYANFLKNIKASGLKLGDGNYDGIMIKNYDVSKIDKKYIKIGHGTIYQYSEDECPIIVLDKKIVRPDSLK